MTYVAWVLFGAVLALSLVWLRERYFSFSAQKPVAFDGTEPMFDLRRHLNGAIMCEGVIYGPTGRVSSRFVADMEARWEGNVGTMTERFRYDSGHVQNREWSLTLGNDGSVRALADDVIGVGTGRQSGAGVQLKYRIRLPRNSGGHVLDATDWMYLIENGSIINHSQFRKFGFKVAELVATMRPRDPM